MPIAQNFFKNGWLIKAKTGKNFQYKMECCVKKKKDYKVGNNSSRLCLKEKIIFLEHPENKMLS